ncbi:unnamed protein product [Malus baccata var. baccata]
MVSTRSTVQKLIPFDLELEQNLRRRREQNLQRVRPLQESFLESVLTGDLHNKEKMAFVIPEAGQPLGDSLTAHTTNIPSCITYPAVEEGTAIEIKQHMLNILPTFHGLSSDDPNMHIAEFLMGCKNILVRGFSAESIKLRLFPYTLKDQAKRWLLTLPSGSISTWAQLNENFLHKYYPTSKTLDMRTQILSFAQKPNEEFHEAWERFKELIRKCPHSGINTTDQMHIFFRGLNMTTKTLVNASCGGSYKDKNAQEACLLFEKKAADTQQWAVEQPQSRSVFEMSNSSPYVTAQIEKMEKRLDAKFDMLLQRKPGSQAAELPQPKSANFADSENSADSGQYQDRSEILQMLQQKLQNVFMNHLCHIQKDEGELKPTSSIIQLADRSITYPRGVIEDVIVKVDNLYLPADFMVLDMDEHLPTPIILGRPFLATARTLIDVEAGTLTFRVEDHTIVFKLFEASIHSGKQKSRWKGPFLVTKVFQKGNVDIKAEGTNFSFKVNKHQLKPSIEKFGVGESSTLKAPMI